MGYGKMIPKDYYFIMEVIMERIIEHAFYGKIAYSENIWTGKRDISINGIKLIKEKKNIYVYDTGEEKIKVTVQGNVYTGICLKIGDETVEVEKKATWYETACSISIFVLIMVWGNSTYLCSIVPIAGGAIGGAISGAMGFTNLLVMKACKNVALKLAVWVAMLIATLIVCFVLALAIILILV